MLITPEEIVRRMSDEDARDFAGYLAHMHPVKPYYELTLFLGPRLFLRFMVKFSDSKALGGINRKRLVYHMKHYITARLRERYLRAFKMRDLNEGGRLEGLYMAAKKGLKLGKRTKEVVNKVSKDLAASRKWRIKLECAEVERRMKQDAVKTLDGSQ